MNWIFSLGSDAFAEVEINNFNTTTLVPLDQVKDALAVLFD